MRKLLLFITSMSIIGYVSAQSYSKSMSTHLPKQQTLMEPPANFSSDMEDYETTSAPRSVRGANATFISIGQSGNAYGFYNNPRTYLWADPMLNSVVFTHRMLGGTEIDGNSRIAYDVSFDGGASWTNNNQVYVPLGPGPQFPEAAGRYPQGAIINPEGNTDPANAFYTYFASTLDNSNGNWGGYGLGINPLTQTDPTTPTQTNLTTENDFFRLIPDAFTVTQQGVAWYVDGSLEFDGTNYLYTGNLILGRGEMNENNDDIVYEEQLIPFAYPFPNIDEGINDMKIAFSPDGQTGYICVMVTLDQDPTPFTSYHPVLLKTTDGGETWEDPIRVQLGGADGLENLKNYFSDEAIIGTGSYEEGFDRDEVYYNMGFQVDIIVDKFGDAHITGIIAIGDTEGWYPNPDQMATWHVYTEDGGDTWAAEALYDNIFLQGEIGDIIQYNRPYAASTYDGQYLFFSLIDTDLEGEDNHDAPNIFVIGYDVEDNRYTPSEMENVTFFTEGWNRAFYGSMSQYVFSTLDEEAQIWECEIPFVYTEFTDPLNDTEPMNFWYIDDFTLSLPVGVDENDPNYVSFDVQQNYPNPASDATSIVVSTNDYDDDITLTIFNLAGQKVFETIERSNAIITNFDIDVSSYSPGVYLYTVTMKDKSVTKKMTIK